MKFTHRKKIYHAMCLQWDGKNTAMIIELLKHIKEIEQDDKRTT